VSRPTIGDPARAAVARAATLVLLWLGAALSARADAIDAAQRILADPARSPIPQGWILGGAAYHGTSTYAAAPPTTLAIPGAIYIGTPWLYLGDRLYYTISNQGPWQFYGRLRVRFGALDPEDEPEWAGMEPRRGQLEAGLGTVLTTPFGLWTARFSSDVSGRSHGTEVLLNWSAPIVGPGWLVMPGLGVFWRSDRLANYYFGGVSPAEAAPGRPAYDVGSTWSWTPQLIASYRFSPRWVGTFLFSYERFADSVRDSPLVDGKGRWDALVAIGYVWK
jgi:outer membrane protein